MRLKHDRRTNIVNIVKAIHSHCP